MTEQLAQAINNTANQLRTLQKQIETETDWLKLEALKQKYKTLDEKCLNLLADLKQSEDNQ